MILDTNIIIAYLNGEAKVVETIREWFSLGLGLYISTITYAEVLALPEASTRDLDLMRQFLDLFVAIPVDKQMAEETAAIKRAEGLKFPDAAIAATARHLNATLVTRDKRLHKVNGLDVVSL